VASNKPESKPSLNVFEAAKARKSSDVTVVWTVKDIQNIRPDWDPRQCEEFLKGVSERFALGVLRLGLTLLQALSVDPRFGGVPLEPNDGPKNSSEF